MDLAQTRADQLRNGAPYFTLKAVIGIRLLDFDLSPDTDQALTRFSGNALWFAKDRYSWAKASYKQPATDSTP